MIWRIFFSFKPPIVLCACHLSDVHAGVAGQRTCRGEIVAAQHWRDDSITIYFPDHCSIHKEDQPIFINGNSWERKIINRWFQKLAKCNKNVNTSDVSIKNAASQLDVWDLYVSWSGHCYLWIKSLRCAMLHHKNRYYSLFNPDGPIFNPQAAEVRNPLF